MPRITRFHLMRWLTRRQEIPFLSTLVFLFFMSGGFLVMQVWGNPDAQGTAAGGLLTPTNIPILNASLPASQEPRVAPPEPAAVPEPAKPSEPIKDADVQPVVAQQPQAPVLPATLPATPATAIEKPVAASPLKKASEPSPKKEKKEKKEKKDKKEAAVVATPEPAMVVAPPLEKEAKVQSRQVSPKKRGRKASPRKEPELSTQPPRGWTWFSAPLEWKVVDGKWKIEVASDSAEEPLTFESREDELLATAVAVEEPLLNEEPSQVQPATVPAPAAAVQEPVENEASSIIATASVSPAETVEATGTQSDNAPSVTLPEEPAKELEGARNLFQKALEKALKQKERRASEAGRLRVDLPSRGGSTRTVPPSLKRLMEAVGQLASQSPLQATQDLVAPVETLGADTLNAGNAQSVPMTTESH